MNKESGWPNQFSLYQQVNFLFENTEKGNI